MGSQQEKGREGDILSRVRNNLVFTCHIGGISFSIEAACWYVLRREVEDTVSLKWIATSCQLCGLRYGREGQFEKKSGIQARSVFCLPAGCLLPHRGADAMIHLRHTLSSTSLH
mmetsp:Transcript_35882/g.90415  ORF Transcript_35882/g.90415 Transcript_35882/m.90415 type:complete len:114 (-) Transcript_35882:259-600(-)